MLQKCSIIQEKFFTNNRTNFFCRKWKKLNSIKEKSIMSAIKEISFTLEKKGRKYFQALLNGHQSKMDREVSRSIFF